MAAMGGKLFKIRFGKSIMIGVLQMGLLANKCTPIQGQRRDRYVQYPKVHSKLVLNREDLKKIATFFVEKKLYPNEDISEQDFWNIVGRYHFNSYYSNRSQRILEENRMN